LLIDRGVAAIESDPVSGGVGESIKPDFDLRRDAEKESELSMIVRRVEDVAGSSRTIWMMWQTRLPGGDVLSVAGRWHQGLARRV